MLAANFSPAMPRRAGEDAKLPAAALRSTPASCMECGPKAGDESGSHDSPLEEDGFELQVPFFEKLCRVLSKENAER
jgi:hypothetical protein